MRGTGRVGHTSTSGKKNQMGRDGVERWRGARTTGDDRLEVDDRVGEGGAVEGLAGHLERREE